MFVASQLILIPMSSLEPFVYPVVIDDVISAIKPEFDEFGVTEEF